MVKVYTDRGITGTSAAKRPGFQEMIRDASAEKIEISRGKWIQTHDYEHTVKPLEIRRSAAVA